MNLTIVQRSCGTCNVCCTHMGVRQIGKPYGVACYEVGEKGCRVYSSRPKGCCDYQCLWLAGWLPEQYRPDIAGVMFHLVADERNPERYIEAYMRDISDERFEFLVNKLFYSKFVKALGVTKLLIAGNGDAPSTDFEINTANYFDDETSPPDQHVLVDKDTFLLLPTKGRSDFLETFEKWCEVTFL